MTEQPQTVISKITPHLSLLEKIFLAGLAIGLILSYSNIDSLVAKVSLVMLAVIYFLSAFTIIEIPKEEDEQFEFKELLSWVIVPKVLWLNSVISLMGFFLYFLHLDNDGYKRALMIGMLGIGLGILYLAYSFLTGTKYLQYVLPTISRAALLLILDLYLLYS